MKLHFLYKLQNPKCSTSKIFIKHNNESTAVTVDHNRLHAICSYILGLMVKSNDMDT